LETARSRGAYSFGSRFEEGAGTNPEESLGAGPCRLLRHGAVADRWSAGFAPDYIDATDHVTMQPHDKGLKITKSHIVCEAAVPGIDRATFATHAETATANCPVSKAPAGIEITFVAALAGA
jgi:osmotically inducible protein OsmC